MQKNNEYNNEYNNEDNSVATDNEVITLIKNSNIPSNIAKNECKKINIPEDLKKNISKITDSYLKKQDKENETIKKMRQDERRALIFSKMIDKNPRESKHEGLAQLEQALNDKDSGIDRFKAVYKNCAEKRTDEWKLPDDENTKQNFTELFNGSTRILKEYVNFVNHSEIKKNLEKYFEEHLEKIKDDNGDAINFIELTNKLSSEDIINKQLPTSIMFKQLFCFASITYDKLEETKETKETEGGQYGGNDDDDDDSESTQQISDQREVVPFYGNPSPTRRRIMWIITFMAYMYFLFVAIENFRLLLIGINTILDYRAEYLDATEGMGEDVADSTYGRYISGFFNVMYEGAMGTLMSTILDYQDNAIERVQYSFRATATAASRTAWQDCNNSFFNCVNQYLTGDLQSHAISSGSDQITYEANRAMNDAVHQVRTQYTQLRSSMSSISNGIITSINGLICTSILLGHMAVPETYPVSLVYSTMGTMPAIYSSGTSIYGLYLTMQNIGILLRPRHAIAMARAATTGLGASQQDETPVGDDGATAHETVDQSAVTNYTDTGSANTDTGSDNTDTGGSPEAAPVVEAQPVSKGILGTIINLMGGKKGKTPKQKKRKNAKRSLKKMKRKSRSSR